MSTRDPEKNGHVGDPLFGKASTTIEIVIVERK
jgi:hypothetical protein